MAFYGDNGLYLTCGFVAKRLRTRFIDKKKGVSGGKASAAILTGGASILVTGLSDQQ